MISQSSQAKASLRIGIYVVLATAVAVRIAYLWYYHSLPEWPMLTVDNWYHHNWALTMVDGNILGDTTYFRAPFYVWTLATAYGLFGPSLWTARILGMVIGVLSIWLTYLIGTRMFDRRVGVTAALVQSFTPIIVYFEGELLLDPFFTLLFQAAVLFFLKWRDTDAKRDLFVSGVFFGLGAITRPTVLPLLIIPVWMLLRSSPPWKKRAESVLLLLVGVILLTGMTLVRNVVVAHDPVLVSSQGGINFYIGNNAESDGLSAMLPDPLGHNWRLEDITYIAEHDAGKQLKQGEVSTYWTRRAVEWVTNNPGRAFLLYLKKLYFSIGNREISNNRAIPAFFDEVPFLKYNPLVFALIFSLAVLGAGIGWRRYRHVKFVVALLGLFLLATAAFFFNSRFRLPIMPYLIVLAAFGGIATYREIRERRWPWFAILAAAGAALVSALPLVPTGGGVSVQPLVSAALFDYHLGNYRGAVALCETALENDSLFPELHLTIGASYLRLAELDSAELHFTSEQELHPLRSKASMNLASLYVLKHDFPLALTYARRAVESRPYDPTGQTILVRVAGLLSSVDTNELDRIVRDGTNAIGNDPQFLLEAAHAYALRGDSTAMRRLLIVAGDATPPPCETDSRMFDPDYRKTLASFSRERAEALHLLSYSYGLMGEADRAMAAARRAITVDSMYSPAYINLTTSLRLLGHSDEADSVAADARRRFPGDTLLKTP